MAMLAALASAYAGWHLAQLDAASQERDTTLDAITRLLARNATLFADLQKAEGIASEPNLLAACLDMIRKDGVPKHSPAKRSIDQIVDNDTAIVTLTRGFLLKDASAPFRAAAAEYMDYEASWRDRW